MANKRRNEDNSIHTLWNYLDKLENSNNKWETKKTKKNKYIQQVLDKSSKKDNGKRGEPDLLYVDNNNKLLILIECKFSVDLHKSPNGDKPIRYAVDGIKHYLKFFLPQELDNRNNNLRNWKIIGIAFSGDIESKYNKQIDTFAIRNNKIENLNISEILDIKSYINLFENIDTEKITSEIAVSSKKINNILRLLDSQLRPVLLSALMISLFDREENDFKVNYKNSNPQTIADNIPLVVKNILTAENIPENKINVFINKLSFLKDDTFLRNGNYLKEILDELNNNVIPLFNRESNYDIIGKFYEEFLRYAGIANVKKGIVLTPHHITALFSDLIELSYNDKIFDPCCGTGAFLIAGMNKLNKIIENSKISNKKELKNNVKEKQLIGFEINSTMYSLAVSNMLFRGDGKSNIHNIDFFSEEAQKIIDREKPTIGFMNPPYGGADTEKNPTKKEIQFLEKMLDSVSKYGIIIAPLSMYFKDNAIRTRILSKHTLKYVINMPPDLFQPNASTHTAIAVFETHKSHNNKEVILYDIREDGLVLSKSKGRTDKYNKWNRIRKNLLEDIKQIENGRKIPNNINVIKKKITGEDEWLLYAHSATDYSLLSQKDFEKSIREYVLFKTRFTLGLLNEKIDEIELIEILKKRGIKKRSVFRKGSNNYINISSKDILSWKGYKLSDLFIIKGTTTTTIDFLESIGKGDYPYVTTQATNNGVKNTYDFYTEEGNVLVIDSAVRGYCSYQELPFSASDHTEKLIPKNFDLNKYIALFLTTIINKEQFRYSYGRKYNQMRIKDTEIKLPTDKGGNPDWQYMENYIKSLPYSASI